MKSFLKITIACFLGGLLLIGFFFMVIMSIASSGEKEVEIEPNSVLHLEFENVIADRGNKNPLENFNFQKLKPTNKTGLNEIYKVIKKAKNDENIKGIFLNLTSLKAGMATIDEIRGVLMDFKKSGKFIISHSDFYTQTSYYLATVADKVYLTPEGSFTLSGLSSEVMYLKGVLEKLGVNAKVIRHGSYKSAAEPLMYDKMSKFNREQMTTFLGALWSNMVKGICEQRKLSENELKVHIDSLHIKFPSDAIKYGLIDGLKYKDNIFAELKKLSKIDKDEKLKLVSYSKYKDVNTSNSKNKLTLDKIAVIYAAGEINMGDGGSEFIGSENISRAIRKARKDKKVKAIVLRVNSPGGSALASEVILREVILARKEKPVVASMGNLAASGGYYISCLADTIVANPMTITGSIGVFGVFMDISGGLKEHLGINVERVKTNPHADLGSRTRPITKREEVIVQEVIDSIYHTFISHVAKGRNMSTVEVDKIGGGRVWSGTNAKKRGLVDVFGGLNDAIQIAANMAGLENYRVLDLPEQKDPMEQILEELMGNVETKIIKNKLGANYKFYQTLESLQSLEGIQARLPYSIKID